jgi:ABC-2 type transport system permease protein
MNNKYTILVKREFWEHRSLWIAPLVTAAFFLAAAICAALFANSFGTPIFGGHINVHSPAPFGPLDQNPVLIGLMGLAAQVFLVSFITCFVYLLDCLYSERKDRSILFWKSMPVSDANTVLVKFTVAMVIVPAAVFALAMITYGLIYGALSLGVPSFAQFTAGSGVGDWFDAQIKLLGMVTASQLWYAPLAAWFMLASVASRRAPSLMAILPPVALGVAESMLFRTGYIWHFLGNRLRPQPDLWHALALPDLWVGLVVAAGMLYMVIRLRRYRDDT